MVTSRKVQRQSFQDQPAESVPDLEVARRLVAEAQAERDKRVTAFLEAFKALCAKYNVEIRTEPVQLTAVALD